MPLEAALLERTQPSGERAAGTLHRSRVRAAARILAASLPALVILLLLDSVLGGWTSPVHNTGRARSLLERIDRAADASVVVLGASTVDGWIKPAYLSRTLGIPREQILDAHLDSCLVDCQFALVRHLVRSGRRFDRVFVGINQGSLCQYPRDTRPIAQLRVLMPREDWPALTELLTRSESPVQATVRMLGVSLSEAYANRDYARQVVRWLTVGHRASESSNAWHHPGSASGWFTGAVLPCAYEPDSIRFMGRWTTRLVEDLSTISSRVVLMLLPDRSVTLTDDAKAALIWQRHRAFHAELAARSPGVTVMDLASGGAQSWESFIDALHLSPTGTVEQQARFEQQLDRLQLR